MSTARELYGNDDWNFTSDKPETKFQRSQKRSKYRVVPPMFSGEHNRSKGHEAIHVCTDGECFNGMVVALPLSLLAWTVIFSLLYLLFH